MSSPPAFPALARALSHPARHWYSGPVKSKVLLLCLAAVLAPWSLLAQDSVPDLSKGELAGRQDFGAWTQILPALLFFVGLALIAGMFLLGEASRRGKQPPVPPDQPPYFPRRFPRPPAPPIPPGPKR